MGLINGLGMMADGVIDGVASVGGGVVGLVSETLVGDGLVPGIIELGEGLAGGVTHVVGGVVGGADEILGISAALEGDEAPPAEVAPEVEAAFNAQPIGVLAPTTVEAPAAPAQEIVVGPLTPVVPVNTAQTQVTQINERTPENPVGEGVKNAKIPVDTARLRELLADSVKPKAETPAAPEVNPLVTAITDPNADVAPVDLMTGLSELTLDQLMNANGDLAVSPEQLMTIIQLQQMESIFGPLAVFQMDLNARPTLANPFFGAPGYNPGANLAMPGNLMPGGINGTVNPMQLNMLQPNYGYTFYNPLNLARP